MEQHITETLQNLGKKWELPGFSMNPNGILHFSIEQIGELYIDIQPNWVYLYMLNHFDKLDFELLATALSFCQMNAQHTFLTNAVLRGDHLLGFVVKMSSEDFITVNCEAAIQELSDLALRLKQFATL